VFQVLFLLDPQASQSSQVPSPTTRTPFGVFLSSTAVPRHRGRYLHVVTDQFRTHHEGATLVCVAPHERVRFR